MPLQSVGCTTELCVQLQGYRLGDGTFGELRAAPLNARTSIGSMLGDSYFDGNFQSSGRSGRLQNCSVEDLRRCCVLWLMQAAL